MNRNVPMLAAASVLALALTGCGPGNGGDAVAGNAPDAATRLTVGASVWHSGYKVSFADAQIESPAPSPSTDRVLTLAVTFQNLGRDSGAFQPEMVLTSGGHHYAEVAREQQELPTVPGQASESGVLAFVVDERFTLADAVLTIGASDERQAVVPLGRPANVVALEPKAMAATGKATDGEFLYATVEGAEVRADDPDRHAEARAGYEFIRVRYSATNTGPGLLTMLYGFANRLVLPDGSSVSTVGSCGNPQLDPGPFGTARGGESCFEVPSPATGKYTYTISKNNAEGFAFMVS
jgi:hypothetical protein